MIRFLLTSSYSSKLVPASFLFLFFFVFFLCCDLSVYLSAVSFMRVSGGSQGLGVLTHTAAERITNIPHNRSPTVPSRPAQRGKHQEHWINNTHTTHTHTHTPSFVLCFLILFSCQNQCFLSSFSLSQQGSSVCARLFFLALQVNNWSPYRN